MLGVFLHHEADLVDIGFALATTRDLDELFCLKFLDEVVDAAEADAEVVSEPLLPGKTEVVVPGVTQEFRIDDDRTHG